MAVDKHKKFRPCCMNSHFANGPDYTIDQYWNSPELAELRSSFVQNQQHPSCKYCWSIESNGNQSLRLESLNRKIQDPYTITQVKLVIGKTCNISCMSCFSTVSSTYAALWRGEPNWIMPEKKLDEVVYDREMDSWIRQHHDQLEYIEFLGGEPLFSKDVINLLDYLVEAGSSSHLTLFVITNGTILNQHIIDRIKQFKKVVFAVSIDAVGLANDYIRWGSRFENLRQNLDAMNQLADISILPTVSALNVLRLPELYEFCDKHQYTIHNINTVDFWQQLNPINLPNSLKSQVDSKFRLFVEGDGNPLPLIDFISTWDKKRNIHINNYMSEWAAVFQSR